MEFYRNLYVGKTVEKRFEKIKEAVKTNKPLPFIHVITMPLWEDGQLEIYPAYVLAQEAYKRQNIRVVGIAGDRREATELVEEMVSDCIKETGSVELGRYFLFD